MAITLAEFAIASGVGATLQLPALANTENAAARSVAIARELFGEGPGGLVLAVPAEHQEGWESYLAAQSVPWHRLGTAGGDTLTVTLPVSGHGEIPLQSTVTQLRAIYEGVLPGYLGD
ncbi:MAG: hypothetical protein HC918_08795 [Oscillatoriales cyanobacterium SM2_1_8]|nr:hypothetical protein [Oscillatoriales cyanobacterium SM2_1_8]